MSAVNTLPIREMAKSTTGCCPPFNLDEWDTQTFEFKDKLFVKVSTHSLFYIPLNMSSVMRRVRAKIDKTGADNIQSSFMLSQDVSPWRAEHYVAVDKDVPGEQMAHLSGTYVVKVFEGEYKNMPIWHQKLLDYVKTLGKTASQTYFSYAMCPKCAKTYGHNYVAGFAQVA